jgi:hypothetical protein
MSLRSGVSLTEMTLRDRSPLDNDASAFSIYCQDSTSFNVNDYFISTESDNSEESRTSLISQKNVPRFVPDISSWVSSNGSIQTEGTFEATTSRCEHHGPNSVFGLGPSIFNSVAFAGSSDQSWENESRPEVDFCNSLDDFVYKPGEFLDHSASLEYLSGSFACLTDPNILPDSLTPSAIVEPQLCALASLNRLDGNSNSALFNFGGDVNCATQNYESGIDGTFDGFNSILSHPLLPNNLSGLVDQTTSAMADPRSAVTDLQLFSTPICTESPSLRTMNSPPPRLVSIDEQQPAQRSVSRGVKLGARAPKRKKGISRKKGSACGLCAEQRVKAS